MKTTLALPLSFSLFLAGFASGEDKAEPVHLFILSGQSNMAGMNPETGFVPEAAKLFGEGNVEFIKVASGGKPIRLWVEEWPEIAAKHGLDAAAEAAKKEGTQFYQPILDQYSKLVEERGAPASVTFCWMQGERDAKEKLDAAYADSMKQLIANLRRDLKAPEMNVVIGRLSDFGKADDAGWQNVRVAQVAVAEEDARGSWVDCDDLNDKEKAGKKVDDLHYTAEGYAELGRRYAQQGKALVGGKGKERTRDEKE